MIHSSPWRPASTARNPFSWIRLDTVTSTRLHQVFLVLVNDQHVIEALVGKNGAIGNEDGRVRIGDGDADAREQAGGQYPAAVHALGIFKPRLTLMVALVLGSTL